jgi:DNA-binding transcriptional regulator YiaG
MKKNQGRHQGEKPQKEEKQFTARTVEVPDPPKFEAARVRALRLRLGLSQSLFARLVGVSTVLVQSWEQGVRVPSPIARRLLGVFEQDPDQWRRSVETRVVQQRFPRR